MTHITTLYSRVEHCLLRLQAYQPPHSCCLIVLSVLRVSFLQPPLPRALQNGWIVPGRYPGIFEREFKALALLH